MHQEVSWGEFYNRTRIVLGFKAIIIIIVIIIPTTTTR